MPEHIVMLGDSIFDNASYTNGRPDVITHLHRRFPESVVYVTDLRLICIDPSDYANPIDPSGNGGAKITVAIAGLERTDCHVVPVRISERKLQGSSIGIHVGLLFESNGERSSPWQGQVEIIDTKEQEKTIAWLAMIRARQRGMIVGTPLVEAEQYGSVRVGKLTKVCVGWCRLRLAEECLVPLETQLDVFHPDDCPRALHETPLSWAS